jgi:hypothetical protein
MMSPAPNASWIGIMDRRLSGFALATIALVSGCNNEDTIRTYTVPKTTEPVAKAPRTTPETSGEVRLLGAFIPTGEPGYNWFVKFSGPSAVVSAAEGEFDQFLASMKYLGEGASRKLDWKAPKGWRAAPAKQFRLATFLVGPADMPVECYISNPFGGDTLSNVNRWREGDAGLPKITEGELPSCTSEFKIGDVKCVRVDLTGPGPVGGKKKNGPFQGN